MLKKILILFVIVLSFKVFSHPMPNTVMELNVNSKSIVCQLQLPVKEMQYAVPFNLSDKDLLKKHQSDISKYILSHFSIKGNSNQNWKIAIQNMHIEKRFVEATGKYEELCINILITPFENENHRQFTLNYDAIMHQVVTHRALITVKQDWENGKVGEENTEIGVISYNINSNKVEPFEVNIAQGSNWKGFKAMVNLGMKHISEGTDHLLFLLVLLLSAPLISVKKRWTNQGTTKYTLVRILKIITAFTIGHSITLIIGAVTSFNPIMKPIEMLIAFSILITAIHAIKPIFPNKEIVVACGFGLIHGLAFATILNELNLDSSKLVLSLLGFNIGIELMQLFVIILVMPWLIILSKFKIYTWVRITGAIISSIAAIAWLFERYTEKSNFISSYLQNSTNLGLWTVFSLACFTIIILLIKKIKI